MIAVILARRRHTQPWSRWLWNPLSCELIQILLNISVLLLNECSRNLVSTLWLVYVTLVPVGSRLHDSVFFYQAWHTYPHMVVISWLIFIPITERGGKCYQQSIYYQKYFMKMHYWIFSQSPLKTVILVMIFVLSLNTFVTICKFSLYLLILILCFLLVYKHLLFTTIQILYLFNI